ncbi:MAG: hypothetical protein ABJF50_01985 [Paracoccaceae bacterium]
MIPTVTAPGAIPQSSVPQSAQKSAQPQLDAARSSAGEAANTTLRAETARAIDAPEQSSTAPRLREQETKERPESVFDDLVGPVPTFKESPLERQARTALDPPEITAPPKTDVEPQDVKDTEEPVITAAEPPTFEDPPPTPAERAEASFAETRTLASEPEPATIDVAR